MIDRAIFDREWAILCVHFRRESSAIVAQRYWEILSEALDTAAFEAACRKVMEREDRWPSPATIIGYGGQPRTAVVDDQWRLCERVMRGERGILERMTPTGRRVVAHMGGPYTLGQTRLEDVRWIRMEFAKLYDQLQDTGGDDYVGRPIAPGTDPKRLAP